MEKTTELSKLIRLIFTVIGIAMPISVIVLNVLGAAADDTQILLLAIGLFGLALGSMNEESK